MTDERNPTAANEDAPAPPAMDLDTTAEQDAQKAPKDPASNPGPPGDNVPNEAALDQARETLERVKPY